jgi:hypothetical protein
MNEDQALRDGWEKLGNISVVLLCLPGVLFLLCWLIGWLFTLLHIEPQINLSAWEVAVQYLFLFTAIGGPILVIIAAVITAMLTFRSPKSSGFSLVSFTIGSYWPDYFCITAFSHSSSVISNCGGGWPT